MPYFYNQNRIFIPPAAEVHGAFRPEREVFSGEVQSALDSIEPWNLHEDPIETFELSRRIGARVVALTQGELHRVQWGINPFHQARNPGISPYLELMNGDKRHETQDFTIELTRTPEKPILTRIYPGNYMPPLPWMNSSKNAPGGLEECLEYWHQHAYIYRGRPSKEALGKDAPEWYKPAEYPLAK